MILLNSSPKVVTGPLPDIILMGGKRVILQLPRLSCMYCYTSTIRDIPLSTVAHTLVSFSLLEYLVNFQQMKVSIPEKLKTTFQNYITRMLELSYESQTKRVFCTDKTR
jgi:hypothetical protein